MSKSLLLKIARESITEVFEAKNTINREKLLQDYPILNEPLAAFVSIYIDKELRGQSGRTKTQTSLLEEIIYHAKTAAFEDKEFGPLKVSEYLRAEIELCLLTPLEEVSYENTHDLLSKIRPNIDGVSLDNGELSVSLLPSDWSLFNSSEDFIQALFKKAHIKNIDSNQHPKIYSFQVEKSRDESILN